MFWENLSFPLQLHWSDELSDEDVMKITLEQLFDKVPNLANEYEGGNKKFLEIIRRKDILENLIKNVIETPPEDLDMKERFKYANLSCVLFTARNNEVEKELIKYKDLLDKLLSFLETDDELNPLMASFFGNTLHSIFNKFPEAIIDYLNERADFFDLIFKHLRSSGIMDFLIKIINIESINKYKIPTKIYRWLNSSNMVKRIFEVFKTEKNIDALENASFILNCFISNARHFTISNNEGREFYKFISIAEPACDKSNDTETNEDANTSVQSESQYDIETFLVELVNICFTHKSSAIHILRVITRFTDHQTHLKIIESFKFKLESSQNSSFFRKVAPQNLSALISESDLGQSHETLNQILNMLRQIRNMSANVANGYLVPVKILHKVVLSNLDKFKTLLLEYEPDYSVETPSGLVKKPVGFLRLELINFFYTLLLANNPLIDEAFANNQILEVLIDLLFEYEYNTFLHNYVNDIVTIVFLNADQNRFKFLTNEQEKAEFLELSNLEKLKEKNLSVMQIINLSWSDKDCYEHVTKIFSSVTGMDWNTFIDPQESRDSLSQQSFSPPLRPPSQTIDPLIDQPNMTYTSLVGQLFSECNLPERIIVRLRDILSPKEDVRQPTPTNKSHLIDICDMINKYLDSCKNQSDELFSQIKTQTKYSEIADKWHEFSNEELTMIKNKIMNVEQGIKTEQDAQEVFQNFLAQGGAKMRTFESNYSPVYDELCKSIFDKLSDVLKLESDPEMPDMSMWKKWVDHNSVEYGKMSIDKELNELFGDKTTDVKPMEHPLKRTHPSYVQDQYSESSELMSSITERDNLFHPLASSSNISNELNIEMDIDDSDIMRESLSMKSESKSRVRVDKETESGFFRRIEAHSQPITSVLNVTSNLVACASENGVVQTVKYLRFDSNCCQWEKNQDIIGSQQAIKEVTFANVNCATILVAFHDAKKATIWELSRFDAFSPAKFVESFAFEKEIKSILLTSAYLFVMFEGHFEYIRLDAMISADETPPVRIDQASPEQMVYVSASFDDRFLVTNRLDVYSIKKSVERYDHSPKQDVICKLVKFAEKTCNFVATRSDGSISLFRFEAEEKWSETLFREPDNAEVQEAKQVIWSHDDSFLIVSLNNQNIIVYVSESGSQIYHFDVHKEEVSVVLRFTKTYSFLTGGLDASLYLHYFDGAKFEPYKLDLNDISSVLSGSSTFDKISLGDSNGNLFIVDQHILIPDLFSDDSVRTSLRTDDLNISHLDETTAQSIDSASSLSESLDPQSVSESDATLEAKTPDNDDWADFERERASK